MSESLAGMLIQEFAPDTVSSVWRALYLSIYSLPRRILLVGSIDDTLELADLAADAADLLIVETDAQTVSTAELLPNGVQWRSLAEFSPNLSTEDRVRLAVALISGLQPAAVMVIGSRAGWEMLARHGRTLRSGIALFAAVAASPDFSATALLQDYLRRCIHVLSVLYGPSERAMHRIADRFALTPDENGKLRDLRRWRDHQGFLSSPGPTE